MCGRITGDDPDPTGEKVAILRHALAQKPHIEGFFFECAAHASASRLQIVATVAAVAAPMFSQRAGHTPRPSPLTPSDLFYLPDSYASLYQWKRDKPRDERQDAAFGRALGCVRGSRGRPHTPSNVRTR